MKNILTAEHQTDYKEEDCFPQTSSFIHQWIRSILFSVSTFLIIFTFLELAVSLFKWPVCLSQGTNCCCTRGWMEPQTHSTLWECLPSSSIVQQHYPGFGPSNKNKAGCPSAAAVLHCTAWFQHLGDRLDILRATTNLIRITFHSVTAR